MARQNKWITLVSCSLSCFLGSLDFGIVNTAIPTIQKDLGASLEMMQWVINSYTLAFIMMVVLGGRLADLWGRRLVNLFGVGLFALSSACAGLFASPELLIVWRFMQGVAIAAVVPSALALITHAFAENTRGRAIGIWSSITSCGMAFGPVLGGVLVSTLGWRWIFYINIPVALVCGVLTLFFVRESRDESAKKQVDLKGMALLSVGLFLLVAACINAPDVGWTSFITLAQFLASGIALLLFYFSELRSSSPTIQFHLFANHTFFSCTLALFCCLSTLSVIFFLAPLYLQLIRGDAPYAAGLMLLPVTGCVILFSPLVGHLTDRISAKKIMLFGLGVLLLGAVFQSRLHADSSLAEIIGSLLLIGLGFTCARNPATIAGLKALPVQLTGVASGAIWMIQNIGSVMGIAVAGTLFRQVYESTHTPEMFLLGYQHAMLALCVLIVITISAVLVSMRKIP